MNTTASFSSEPSWSRRCSTETIFSIQGKETDFVRDTSDTEWFGSDGEGAVEYEPATEPEDDGPLSGDSSGHSDNEIITTKVIEVSVGDDGELQLADSELTASSSDSEMDLHDYWLCAHCRAQNNNPLYRYCEKCFKERKNFFPPRPKRKRKRTRIDPETLPRTLSQDSGVETAANSQELSQNDFGQCSQKSVSETVLGTGTSTPETISLKPHLKRRHELTDRYRKRIRIDYSDTDSDSDSDTSKSTCSKDEVKDNGPLVTVGDTEVDIHLESNLVVENDTAKNCESYINNIDTVSDTENNAVKASSKTLNNFEVRSKMVSDTETDIIVRSKSSISMSEENIKVASLVKMVSDPALTIEDSLDVKITKKTIINTIKEKLDIDSKDNLCIVCLAEPKSGVFVHGRIAHICCCYKCAVKVWSKAKRCPVCNCKVSNVLKAVVM